MVDLAEGALEEEDSSEELEAARKEEEKGDLDLSNIFNLDEEDEEGEPHGEEKATEKATEDPRYDSLKEELASLREKQVELATENSIYKQQLQTPQPQPQTQTPAEPEDEIDLEELNKALSENPGKAVVDLINKVTVKALKRAEVMAARVSSDITQSQSTLQSDHQRAISDYGDWWQKDKAFTDLTERFYAQLTQNSPVINREGQRYAPGAIQASMAAAYGQLIREGKLNPKVAVLKERRPMPAKPLLGSKTDAGTPEDHLFSGIPAREISAMKRTAAKLGVSWDKYKESIVSSVKKDPNFGGFKR